MGIAIVNSLLDVANIAIAVVFLWDVRMRWRPKALVLALFAARLLYDNVILCFRLCAWLT